MVRRRASKRNRRRCRLLTCVFCLCAGSTGLVGDDWFRSPVAAQETRAQETQRANKESAERSVAEITAKREAIHKLMLNGEYQHDGSTELLYIGDISSVPALLQVLKDNPPTRMPDGKLIGICTAAHAYQALVKITGNRESKTFEEWSAWWEKYQKDIFIIKSDIPPDVVITLERTICYGPCPMYTLTVKADGSVNFQPRYVRGRDIVAGNSKRGRITKEKVKELISEFERADYFSFKDSYKLFESECPESWSDHPSAITSLTIKGRFKTINHDYGCQGNPVLEKLSKLEKKIDEIVNTKRWLN